MQRSSLIRVVQIAGVALLLITIISSTFFVVNSQLKKVQAKAAVQPHATHLSDPIILIHGFNGDNNSTDCNADWGTAKSFIQGLSLPYIQWTGPIVELGYYSKDTNCVNGSGQKVNLSTPNSDWRTHCVKYDGTKEAQVGTNNESIRHIACELAWYLYDNYGQYGINVRIGAYSMGGLISRYAVYAVQKHTAHFPPLLYVSNIVDFDAPNGGATILPGSNSQPSPNGLLCFFLCLQYQQMLPGSSFIKELNNQAQNPQGSAGTSWTLLGSAYNLITCDFLHASTSLYMDSDYKILYNAPCYPHTGANDMLQDNSTNLNASVAYCNSCTKAQAKKTSTWTQSSIYPHPLLEMLDAFDSSTPTTNPIASLTTNGQDACTTNVLPANDDNSTAAIPLPFTANFFGFTYSNVFVNNNGYVTFDGPTNDYTPYPLSSTTHAIIAPFFADVDTRGTGSNQVTYGSGTYGGYAAFCVDWVNVGYYNSHVDKLNSFQLLLVDRSDRRAGDFDIIMNYSQLQWETGDASGGTQGFGGTSARAGFSNGTTTYYELFGSGINGVLLDSNTNGLVHSSQNTEQLGRYLFAVQNIGMAVQGKTTSTRPQPKVKPLH